MDRNHRVLNRNRSIVNWWTLSATVWILVAGTVTQLPASEIDGFAEPYRTIQVAAGEMGIIAELFVREGQEVQKGQELAVLEHDVLLASLKVAGAQMQAKGQLDSVLAELRLRTTRLAALQALRENGNANQQEVDRAAAEVVMAQARALSARESLNVKRLEFEKIKVQIDRKTIRSPIDGVITKTHKDIGEFVAPNEPVVLTVVQLDPLLATFSVTAGQAKQLSVGQSIPVRFSSARKSARGEIEFVSPVTDAESGTVRIKVRISNTKGTYRSGERCTLNLPARRPADLTSRKGL